MDYKVTIGIPVYNTEKYIRRAMESVMAQTLQSVEILIYNDGSSDSSIDIIEEYRQSHSCGKDIHIINQLGNMGVGYARNCLVDNAQGRYIYFLDADDEIVPDTLEKLYTAAQTIDADLVYGSYQRVEDFCNGNNTVEFRYPRLTFSNEDSFASYVYRKYDGIQAPIWNILINVDFIRKCGVRFPAINFWEDFVVTMFLPTYAVKVILLSDVTYVYHSRYGSLSNLQQRSNIDRGEVESVVNAMTLQKQKCINYINKVYFSRLYNKVMMTHFYMACTILKYRAIIIPPFTNAEIRDILDAPLPVELNFPYYRILPLNFSLFLLGKLPAHLSVLLMKIVAKRRRLL